jgi:hypothetical protein
MSRFTSSTVPASAYLGLQYRSTVDPDCGSMAGGAAKSEDNKAEDDGASFSTTRLGQCGRLAADAVGGRLCHPARNAGRGTAARPSPDLVLPFVGPL